MNILTRVSHFFQETLWRIPLDGMDRTRKFLVLALRIGYVLVRDIHRGVLSLHAMSLVYTTLLSLVPFLAVSFSVLKAFGVHNMIEPTLANFLAPLGPKGAEVTNQIIGFVENMRVGVLGSLGVAVLLYTVVSLVRKVETSFNAIWHVETARAFTQQFSGYMSVILVGPVLVFSAVGMTVSVMNTEVMLRLQEIKIFGAVFTFAGQMLPYFFAIAAFTFAYKFIPHTQVKLRAALLGGVVAGVVWNATGYAFAYFVVSSTKYTAIYSGFAILILFIIWIYLSWLILLLGSVVALYTQTPELIRKEHGPRALSNRYKEYLALSLMLQITERFRRSQPPATDADLMQSNAERKETVQRVLRLLQRQGYVVATATIPAGYLPARPPAEIRVGELLSAVRGMQDGSAADTLCNAAAAQLLAEAEAAMQSVLGKKSIEDALLMMEPAKMSGLKAQK